MVKHVHQHQDIKQLAKQNKTKKTPDCSHSVEIDMKRLTWASTCQREMDVLPS